MIRAINLAKRIDFVSDDDPGKGTDDATVFHLKVLTSWQQAVVNDLIASFDAGAMQSGEAGATQMRIHQAAIVAAQMSLDGWVNFCDETGAPVDFATERKTLGGRAMQCVKSELLDQLPMSVIFGIYRALTETASPSEEQVKNSVAA